MISGGHTTESSLKLVYSSVISLYSISNVLNISMFNVLSILACEVHNAYFFKFCRDKIWSVSGTEFVSYVVENILIVFLYIY